MKRLTDRNRRQKSISEYMHNVARCLLLLIRICIYGFLLYVTIKVMFYLVRLI
jgi:hypothetical protein